MADTRSSGVFLRDASGLVKTAGSFDVFTYNLGLISVGIAVALAHYWVPSNYVGANLPLAEVFAALFMACIAWAFWHWSVAIPRSGGIYAYVSRGLNPGLGFTVSFIDTFTWLFYNALAASFITSLGIAPAVFCLGYFNHSEQLLSLASRLSHPKAQFLIGGVAIVGAGIVLALGMKTFFKLQKVLFAVAVLGSIVALGALSRVDPSSSDRMLRSVFGGVLPLSDSQPVLQGWSLKATVLASVWPILSFVGSIFSINIGGEVQRASRSQAIGMFGSIVVAVVLMVALSAVGNAAFGQLQAKITAAAIATPDRLPIQPYYPVLAGIASGRAWVAVVICLGFMAWAFFWIPATLVYAARALLAWSFDRAAPASFGYVDPRLHSPTVAIAAVVVINIVFLWLFLFTSFFGTLVLVLAAMLAWIPTMASTVLFPYTRRSLYERTALAGKKLIGIPSMTLAGILGLSAVLVLTVLLWNDPIAAGHSVQSLGTIGFVLALGALWYGAAKLIRRRQGIDISRAYAEIPIE